MRVLTLTTVAGLILLASQAVAQQQTPPGQAKPPAQAAPAQKPPAQKPATPPAQQPAAPPAVPVPFPEGAKVAYVDVQRIANDSIEGKGYAAKVQALNQKRSGELAEKNKALQANQQKLSQGANAMNESAQASLQKEIERQQVEIQRFTQDAQAEIQELQTQLQAEFQKKIIPIIEQVAVKRGLLMIFSREAGIVWANAGLDLTAEVIKAFDAAAISPAPKPPAPEK
jgi:outer membrane protein